VANIRVPAQNAAVTHNIRRGWPKEVPRFTTRIVTDDNDINNDINNDVAVVVST
jgi:hypothetical protein